MLEDQAKGSAAASCPPFMQIGIRPVIMFIKDFQVSQLVGQGSVKTLVSRGKRPFSGVNFIGSIVIASPLDKPIRSLANGWPIWYDGLIRDVIR